MAKIESVRDLPEWFDIEKYKGCESFGAADWYEALHCRSGILAYLPHINHPEMADSSLQTEIAQTRENPLYIEDRDTPRSEFCTLPVGSLIFGRLLTQCAIERFLKTDKSKRPPNSPCMP